MPGFAFTAFLDNKKVVVVGGGLVATRRVLKLQAAGADVVVISPDLSPTIAALVKQGKVSYHQRGYEPADLAGAWLVVTATGNPAVDDQVISDATSRQIFCFKGGDPAGGSAWSMASGEAAGIRLALNAAGTPNPKRSAWVRDRLLVQVPGLVAAFEAANEDHGQTVAELKPGWVALVGGGPGADDLVTLRGWELLKSAQVIVVDRLAPHGLLAELNPEIEVIDVGKSAGDHPIPQSEINQILVDRALSELNVVRLKGGDAYVFGRGGEEYDACRAAGVQVEVVPGVTSAISVPAQAGIPITHRGLSRGFTVITGHEDIAALPVAPDHTIVLLMGLFRLAKTAETLVSVGHDATTPAAVISDGYGPNFQVVTGTLANIAQVALDAGIKPPAITVIGQVVTRSPHYQVATN